MRLGLLKSMVWLLPYFMEDKALAIWLSMPVSDVLCNVATIPPILMHARFLAKVRSRCGGRESCGDLPPD